jgi:hypothetical protein
MSSHLSRICNDPAYTPHAPTPAPNQTPTQTHTQALIRAPHRSAGVAGVLSFLTLECRAGGIAATHPVSSRPSSSSVGDTTAPKEEGFFSKMLSSTKKRQEKRNATNTQTLNHACQPEPKHCCIIDDQCIPENTRWFSTCNTHPPQNNQHDG